MFYSVQFQTIFLVRGECMVEKGLITYWILIPMTCMFVIWTILLVRDESPISPRPIYIYEPCVVLICCCFCCRLLEVKNCCSCLLVLIVVVVEKLLKSCSCWKLLLSLLLILLVDVLVVVLSLVAVVVLLLVKIITKCKFLNKNFKVIPNIRQSIS